MQNITTINVPVENVSTPNKSGEGNSNMLYYFILYSSLQISARLLYTVVLPILGNNVAVASLVLAASGYLDPTLHPYTAPVINTVLIPPQTFVIVVGQIISTLYSNFGGAVANGQGALMFPA